MYWLHIKHSSIYLLILLLLIVSLFIYKDYGVHWDENNNQDFGNKTLSYISSVLKNKSLNQSKKLSITHEGPSQHSSIHGPIVETTLALLKKYLQLRDSRDVILFRHFSCFIIFLLGIYFFFLLCQLYFNNWILSLLGCIFLSLSPRIFAHAFYDTVDIPFLSFYILSCYTFLRWQIKKTLPSCLNHVIACSLLIGVRPLGLLIPLISVCFMIFHNFKENSSIIIKKNNIQTLVFLILLPLLIICTWPILWTDPLNNSIRLFQINKDFIFEYPNLYLGKILLTSELPWHYIPIWIFITTPLLYCTLFVLGTFQCIRILVSSNRKQFNKENLIFLLFCLILPIICTIGKVYNSWRHLFFIYPLLLIISLYGLRWLWELIQRRACDYQKLMLHILIVLIVLFSLIDTLFTMKRIHPFQFVYFNQLAGRDMKEIQQRFDLDYWGLSYKQALERLVSIVQHQEILLEESPMAYFNKKILPPKERKRIHFRSTKKADYRIYNSLFIMTKESPQQYKYTRDKIRQNQKLFPNKFDFYYWNIPAKEIPKALEQNDDIAYSLIQAIEIDTVSLIEIYKLKRTSF